MAVVGAVVATLSLSSCLVLPFLPTDDSGNSSSADPTFAPQSPPTGTTGLDTFYSQRLQWTSCSGGECAKLRVPIDYANPGGETMQLAVIRSKARSSGQRLGSLVYNPGGPGASPVQYISQSASSLVSSDVRRRYDLVGFDPRGVGRSQPIDCVSDSESTRSSAASTRRPTRRPRSRDSSPRRRSSPTDAPPRTPSSSPTSRRWTRPATWTSSAPRSASRS